MTDTPAIGEHPDTDSDETRTLRREMVTALVNDGTLTDDRWTQTFLAVPRHVLVPTYYQANKHIDGPTNRERWLQLVYSDTTLITQRQPDAVTSSGTMPSLGIILLHPMASGSGWTHPTVTIDGRWVDVTASPSCPLVRGPWSP